MKGSRRVRQRVMRVIDWMRHCVIRMATKRHGNNEYDSGQLFTKASGEPPDYAAWVDA